jgi:N-acetylmuramoyl-L-alanine amidase
MRILINAGHGGNDSGACGNGLREVDINKKIATKLFEYLIGDGHAVTFFQQTKSVNDVWQFENKCSYDLTISIHCNSFNSTSHGHEVLYYPTSTKGKKLAQSIQTALVKTVGLRDRGVKPRKDLCVLTRTKSVAVIVETAFISNPNEAKLLGENPALFAKAIAEGVKNYLKN